MVDTHVLVEFCAQIGEQIYPSAGVSIGFFSYQLKHFLSLFKIIFYWRKLSTLTSGFHINNKVVLRAGCLYPYLSLYIIQFIIRFMTHFEHAELKTNQVEPCSQKVPT